MKNGYLENDIDVMFVSEAGIASEKFEQEEMFMSNKYEEIENKRRFLDIDNIKSRSDMMKSSISITSPVNATTARDAESDDEKFDDEMPIEGTIAIGDNAQDDIEDDDPKNGVYESPFRPNIGNTNDKADLKSEEDDEEFPDKDVQMKIRDKDVVFIYEIDDIIKEFISAKKEKTLDDGEEILDVLNRYSKLFRHYIRYRVVEIGDLIGGLFLDGFWKTLLITIDKILQSVDQRCRNRIYRMHQEYEKLNDLMHTRLAEKDELMRLMDKTEQINQLEHKLKLIIDEKGMYQRLAQRQ